MTDGWMKARTKGQHREPEPDDARVTALPGMQAPPPGPPGPLDAQPGGDVQQALQMLTLAQRTAEEHVATAHRQSDRILADARGMAERIVGEAQTQAEAVRREADKVLTDARAQAEQSVKEIQAHAQTARQSGEKIVTDARAQATEIVKDARAKADGLERLARQRYDEEVGNLAAKREGLQQQIESLQEFDRDYRSRLLTFMQAQLRALWVDEPHVDGDISRPTTSDPATTPAPAPPAAPDDNLLYARWRSPKGTSSARRASPWSLCTIRFAIT